MAGISQLDYHLARFESEFPFGAQVLRLFRATDATVTYAAPVHVKAAPRSWELHVRLPLRLEEHFGVSRQFLAYCSTINDLQPRDIARVKALVEGARLPIETDLAMLITADPQTRDKLVDWGAERTAGMILIPTHRLQLDELLNRDDAHAALPELISGWISAYNLYDQRQPVTGERFYGRAHLLRDLDRKLAQGAGHVGIFGLRRIGKTSVLLELKERLRSRAQVVPVFIDLEGSSTSAHVAYRIGEELAKAVARRSSLSEAAARRGFRLPEDWGAVDARTLIAGVGDNLRNALTAGALEGSRLVLILDEAEMLLPTTDRPKEYAIDLFRVLRGVAQETRALTLVLAGVNATPAESPFIQEEDNPLFGLLSIQYLGPLTPEECREMVRTVGRRMQIRWDAPALTTLVEDVGAHPLLARLAASDVATEFSERPLRPNIEQVNAVLREFPRRNSAIFTQMVSSLRRYYPDELELLRLVANDELEFALEFAAENPTMVNHLVGYGVIDEQHMTIAMPAFLRWLRTEGF